MQGAHTKPSLLRSDLAPGSWDEIIAHALPWCGGLFALCFVVECFIVQGYLLIPKYNNKNHIFHKYTGQGWAHSQACGEKNILDLVSLHLEPVFI